MCAQSIPDDSDVHARIEAGTGIRQEYDRCLEALGLVQVHEAYYVALTWFERQRLDFARRLAVRFESVSGLGETVTVLKDLADAINGMQEITSFDAAGSGRGEREIACNIENPFKGGSCRENASPAEHVPQGGKRRPNSTASTSCLNASTA